MCTLPIPVHLRSPKSIRLVLGMKERCLLSSIPTALWVTRLFETMTQSSTFPKFCSIKNTSLIICEQNLRNQLKNNPQKKTEKIVPIENKGEGKR